MSSGVPFSETELFPAGVAHFSMPYDPDANVVEDRPLGVALPAALQRAVPKRRFEFAVGRRCVREALRQLAPALQSTEVGVGSQREPLFPAGVVGAISHGAGIASAAVAWQREFSGVGVDIEGWIADDVLPSLERSVLVAGEARRLQQHTGWPAVRVATIVFSAKETLFKCLFPSVKRYFDFKDAEIESIDPAASSFTARLLVSLTDELRERDTFVGRLQVTDSLVITSMTTSAGA